MLFNGDKKCICYLTTIDKAITFNKILTFIASIFNVEIEREQIDCNTKRLKRNEIIEKFIKRDNIFILLNVHVLDEGIDIPECDSVYVTQPNNNILNLVQRMCRANRIYKNKTFCNIYLWCNEKKTNKILNYLFEKTDMTIKNKINKISTKDLKEEHCELKSVNNNQNNNNVINKNYNIIKNELFLNTEHPEIQTDSNTCMYCNTTFVQKVSLNRHLKKSCKSKNFFQEREKIIEKVTLITNNYQNIEKENKHLKEDYEQLKNIIYIMNDTKNIKNNKNDNEIINNDKLYKVIKIKEHICNICKKSFKQKSHLDKHMFNKIRPCSPKDIEFSSKNTNNLPKNIEPLTINTEELINNKKEDINNNYTFLNNNLNSLPSIDPQKISTNSNTCTYCNTTFVQKGSLSRHLKDRCKMKIKLDQCLSLNLGEIKIQLSYCFFSCSKSK
jgi:hypothetical protein